jgi:hypothetical protein
MDELIIDEKKYISSKQAAKVTGYAKDYVGQLCREGRVQAQLVGRSWYVLESAILDHRFGADAPQAATSESKDADAEAPAVWQPPRYEAAQNEPLPVVERSEVIEVLDRPVEELGEVQLSTPSFDIVPPKLDVVEQAVNVEAEETSVEEAAISQPIEPGVPLAAPVQPVRVRRRKGRRALYASIRLVCIVIGFVSVALAALNSGYFDNNLYSSTRAHLLTGISVFKK